MNNGILLEGGKVGALGFDGGAHLVRVGVALGSQAVAGGFGRSEAVMMERAAVSARASCQAVRESG